MNARKENVIRFMFGSFGPGFSFREGAHDFLGNSANTDLIRQAKGEREPGQAPEPTPTLETNKQCLDHVILTGRQMKNLVSNFEYLLLFRYLTTAEF